MKRTGILKTLLITSIVFISCAGSNSTTNTNSQPPEGAVGQLNGNYVFYDELKENYLSGSINSEYNLEELQEFLPIYLDYRAKLIQAEETGYFENPTILEELELYSQQAAYAYWLDQEIRPTLFNSFKEKFTYELKSSHVLIALDSNASPEDTARVYNLLLEAREKFLSGTSMAELDTEYSTKRNGRSMGGDLPWISVGTTVADFENALYSLEVGGVSMPIRTQFGYHMIHLEDKRERQASREVSHIFVRRGRGESKIDSAYSRLIQNESWDSVVREYSDDSPSVPRDGNIGWVDYTARYELPFVDLVMKLDPQVDFTEPIESPYGIHIFRVDSVREFATEEAKNDFIMRTMEENNLIRESNNFIIDYLQSDYPQSIHDDNHDVARTFIATSDTVRFDEIVPPTEFDTLIVYEYAGDTYSASDYLSYLAETRGERLNTTYTPNWFNTFHDYVVEQKVTELTLAKFPEFQEQIDSYKFGIVVYQINEDSVWSAATVDTTLLERRYSNNLDDYSFGERSYYYMITSRNDTTLDNATTFVLEGNSPDSLISNGFNVGVNSDSTGAFQGEPFTLLESMSPNSFSEYFDYGQRRGTLYLVDVLAPRTMSFEEAFNRVLSDFLPEREENWLQRLRSTYNVQSYPETLVEQFNLENSSDI